MSYRFTDDVCHIRQNVYNDVSVYEDHIGAQGDCPKLVNRPLIKKLFLCKIFLEPKFDLKIEFLSFPRFEQSDTRL